MTDQNQQFEELKQMYYQKFPKGAQVEPVSKAETLKYSQLPEVGTKEEVDQVVIQALSRGEITGDELHEKIQGYPATQCLESFLYLLNEGYMVQTETGFKLTPLCQARQELLNILSSLKEVYASMQSAELDRHALNTAISDAITAITNACARAMDAPDE